MWYCGDHNGTGPLAKLARLFVSQYTPEHSEADSFRVGRYGLFICLRSPWWYKLEGRPLRPDPPLYRGQHKKALCLSFICALKIKKKINSVCSGFQMCFCPPDTFGRDNRNAWWYSFLKINIFLLLSHHSIERKKNKAKSNKYTFLVHPLTVFFNG